jgi:peptidoglycan/LPS O-acetylase OafA/YrhL
LSDRNHERYVTLDSLRGIASLSVVVGHCIGALPAISWMYEHPQKRPNHDILYFLAYSPLHFFWAGQMAVIVFFMLSGFVLSIPFYQKDITRAGYFIFFVKRNLRLYIPCLCILIIAYIVKITYYNPVATLTYGPGAKGYLSYNASGYALLKLFLLREGQTNWVPALWTLTPEIELSLLIPLFVYLLRRLNVLWSIITIFVVILLNAVVKRIGGYSIIPDLSSFYYMTFFLMGSLICKYRSAMVGWVNAINNTPFYLLLICSAFLYTFSFSMFWLPSKMYSLLAHWEDYIISIAGVFFMLFALSKRFENVLNHRFLIFLGKISFSLYLIHYIVMLSCVYLFGNFLNQYLVIGSALILSIPAAVIFYELVEINAIKIAKVFSTWLYNLIRKTANTFKMSF